MKKKSVVYLAAKGWRLKFHIWLDERDHNRLRQLRDMLSSCALSNEDDNFKWVWEKTGKFSVKSLHSHLGSNETNNANIKIWKSKTPLKIKILHVGGISGCYFD